MPQHDLDFLFHPSSLALVGITTAKTWHWTLTFLEGLLEIGFDRPLYLVNPKGGRSEVTRFTPASERSPATSTT